MKDKRLISVVVVGASGMLGSMVLDVLSREDKLKLIATVRSEELAKQGRVLYEDVEWRVLDAEATTVAALASIIGDAAWVINNIGIIKPYIRDDKSDEVQRAIAVNAFFPFNLAQAAALNGAKVLQIATDCVYSGNKGSYVETDPHDALDVYGKTKSLGEVQLPNVVNLRCSIIGPEPKSYTSLLEWFRRQPPDAEVGGYTNHSWNGVTTLHFARLCTGIILEDMRLSHLQHVIPADVLSKAELLQCFAKAYQREDIIVNPTVANTMIDRTLATENKMLNRVLWSAAGYVEPPSVSQMVSEMAQFDCRS